MWTSTMSYSPEQKHWSKMIKMSQCVCIYEEKENLEGIIYCKKEKKNSWWSLSGVVLSSDEEKKKEAEGRM